VPLSFTVGEGLTLEYQTFDQADTSGTLFRYMDSSNTTAVCPITYELWDIANNDLVSLNADIAPYFSLQSGTIFTVASGTPDSLILSGPSRLFNLKVIAKIAMAQQTNFKEINLDLTIFHQCNLASLGLVSAPPELLYVD